MSIKIKNRDPKSTDFSPNDIIVNVKDGTLFYKSDKALFKLQGDNLNTPTTENSFESSINITAFSGSFQYITASVIDVDAETIRFGGTSLARTDVQNLKTGLFNHITASGNISASGTGSFSDGRFTGNVGIGTTSPDSLLEISSNSATDFLKLTSGGGSATPVKLIFEKSGAEQGIIEYNRNGDLEIYNTDGDGGVMIDGSTSAGGDLYVANSGNVGIGITTPTEKLQVTGNISASGDIQFNTLTGTINGGTF